MIATPRQLKAKPQPAEPPPRELGNIEVEIPKVTRFTLHLDALATSGDWRQRTIQILSCAGPHSAIKSLWACLVGNDARPVFRAQGGNFQNHQTLFANPAGYVTKQAKLPNCYGYYHLLMTAKQPGLMPVVDDAALANEFRSERFTTPFLKKWVPWLRETLEKGGKLTMLDCFQCHAGLLTVTPEELDQAVCGGVEFGELEIG